MAIFSTVGFWIYLGFLLIYLLFTIPPIFTSGKYFVPIKNKLLKRLSLEEYDFLKRHALYYMYPFGARSFSAIASFLQLLGLVFGIIFLIRIYWFYGIVCILNYPIFAFIAASLNKPFFLAEALQKGTTDMAILRESQLAQRVGAFMETEWRDVIEEIKLEKKGQDATYED